MSGFACPRCGASVEERFYGPCSGCRQQLVATLGASPPSSGLSSESSEAPTETRRYEPSMHVVPNHVATKD